jgi:hypothetical protein
MPHWIPAWNATSLVSMGLIHMESLAPATNSHISHSSTSYTITSPMYQWPNPCNIVQTMYTPLGHSQISSIGKTIRPSVELQSQLTIYHSSLAANISRTHITLPLASPLMVLEYSTMVRLQFGHSSYSTTTFPPGLNFTLTTSFPLASSLGPTNLQSQTHS